MHKCTNSLIGAFSIYIFFSLITFSVQGGGRQLHKVGDSGTTKRQFPASAGSGAPAGSELQLLPDFGAPVITKAYVQTGAPIPTGALAELSL